MRYLVFIFLAATYVAETSSARTDHAEISIIGKDNLIQEPGTYKFGYKFTFTPGCIPIGLILVILADHRPFHIKVPRVG